MDYHFGQKNGSHFSTVTHPKHSSKVRYKEDQPLLHRAMQTISLTTAYFTKPRCFKNSWLYLSHFPPAQTGGLEEASCLDPPDNWSHSGVSSSPYSHSGAFNGSSHHDYLLLWSIMFQDMTQGPPDTYHLPGMTPGEHQGADAQHQFRCYSRHPITTDQCGG